MNAPDKATEIKALITAAITFLTILWGWVGWAILVMIACMAMDYLTGTWAAKATGTWSSAIARDGLWHKRGEIAALLTAALCDIALQVIVNSAAAPIFGDFEYGHYLTLIVAIWYSLTEIGSILENAKKMGAPIPEWLISGVAKIKDKAGAAQPAAAGVSDVDTEPYEGKHARTPDLPAADDYAGDD